MKYRKYDGMFSKGSRSHAPTSEFELDPTEAKPIITYKGKTLSVDEIERAIRKLEEIDTLKKAGTATIDKSTISAGFPSGTNPLGGLGSGMGVRSTGSTIAASGAIPFQSPLTMEGVLTATLVTMSARATKELSSLLDEDWSVLITVAHASPYKVTVVVRPMNEPGEPRSIPVIEYNSTGGEAAVINDFIAFVSISGLMPMLIQGMVKRKLISDDMCSL